MKERCYYDVHAVTLPVWNKDGVRKVENIGFFADEKNAKFAGRLVNNIILTCSGELGIVAIEDYDVNELKVPESQMGYLTSYFNYYDNDLGMQIFMMENPYSAYYYSKKGHEALSKLCKETEQEQMRHEKQDKMPSQRGE